MAEIVRRRSFGAVLPLGRHISISGSRPIQCASDSIALSSFQEEQNARHYKQFKFEQALKLQEVAVLPCDAAVDQARQNVCSGIEAHYQLRFACRASASENGRTSSSMYSGS